VLDCPAERVQTAGDGGRRAERGRRHKEVKMKAVFAVLAATMLIGVQAEAADDLEARRAEAEKLLGLFNLDKTYDQTVRQAVGMATNMLGGQKMSEQEREKAVQAVEASVNVTLEKFSWARMKTMFVDIYSEVLSLEELRGLVAFYESPVGRKFIAKQPELTAATMKKMQVLFQDILPQIQQEVEKSIKSAAPAK
jgi:uncharacterized protein